MTTAPTASAKPALLVKLDVFDGPLDLLLQLVLQQDLDITQVSLASVCEQYLSYLSLMEALDIGIASEYLVIAATLIFIKSKKLVPPPPPPFDQDFTDDAAIAEEALRQRLIAYRHFKDAGGHLRERMETAAAYYPRPAEAFELEGLVQRYVLDSKTLAAAFMRALENAEVRPAVLKREAFSVVVKMNYVLRLVRERESLTFTELVAGCAPLEIVVTFLAVLELIRARKVRYEQSKLFDDIVFTPMPKGAVDDLAQSA
ncbi:MAG TPA: segregation/condensation protein A [Candidatus Eremiobacteraceae bacterium]